MDLDRQLGIRAELSDLHISLFAHAIASSELAHGGERAYPVDRPPPWMWTGV
jgi:hypothetical protein